MVVGALAAHTALREGRLDELRTPDAPWLARTVKRERDDALSTWPETAS